MVYLISLDLSLSLSPFFIPMGDVHKCALICCQTAQSVHQGDERKEGRERRRE